MIRTTTELQDSVLQLQLSIHFFFFVFHFSERKIVKLIKIIYTGIQYNNANTEDMKTILVHHSHPQTLNRSYLFVYNFASMSILPHKR